MTDCYESMYDNNRIVPPYEENARSVDWRNQNVITPVKDQGGCGSCWTFMATHPFEASIAIKTGVLYRISQQQLVDCDKTYNAGCSGGWPTDSWEYYSTVGAVLDEDYPYTGRDESCKDANLEKVAYTTSAAYRYVTDGDKEAMKTALRRRPLSVAFSVGNAFYNYDSGIFSDDGSGDICASGVNHGMTGVGFGIENGVEYVIVKNSWG